MTIRAHFKALLRVAGGRCALLCGVLFAGAGCSDRPGEPAYMAPAGLNGPPSSSAPGTAVSEARVAPVTEERIRAADEEPQNWLSHGRNYSEDRFSPLAEINTGNVARLGLSWEFHTGTLRGLEATPLVVDGILYATTTWSRVLALRADTGELIWQYDPQISRKIANRICCGPVNRGVAIWNDKVYAATLDGYLVALDAASGEPVWRVDTLVDRSRWYSITGAPRVVRGKVIIGNGGAEFNVRGYLSAYDAATGELAWRFFTVPAGPGGPFEHSELEWAAETWDRQSNWSGAGGTVWDSMAYDAELNLLYVGTGNGSPWPRSLRSPSGGDNLFLSSILALRPEDGRLIWHYQTTPGDSWDYTATQHMILADLEIAGDPKRVLLQAPKNGFFYVLDRETGELLSAEKYVHANWAERIDLETGRPVETGIGDYTDRDTYVFPSPAGGHNWHPMAYSPESGLVYIPARDIGWVFSPRGDTIFTYGAKSLDLPGNDPAVPETSGYLKAWDPLRQRLVWQISLPTIWNGGALATAGGLVFQGTGTGYLYAMDAATGELLKEIFLGTGVVAPPISYAVGGEQYIAVLAGWGGPTAMAMQGEEAAATYVNAGRVLAFKLDGGAVDTPPLRPARRIAATLSLDSIDRDAAEHGRMLYVRNCGWCHGVYGSTPMLPDLRYMSAEVHQLFDEIVLEGLYEAKGMASFAEHLSKPDVDAIYAYILTMTEEAGLGRGRSDE
jgi:quinohemoprotein ethanol dehydrogenase